MGMFIVMPCPVGIAVALTRRCARTVPAGQPAFDTLQCKA
jgi:hypothetical protein